MPHCIRCGADIPLLFEDAELPIGKYRPRYDTDLADDGQYLGAVDRDHELPCAYTPLEDSDFWVPHHQVRVKDIRPPLGFQLFSRRLLRIQGEPIDKYELRRHEEMDRLY